MLDQLIMWRAYLQAALFLAALVLAWRYGQAPERLCAAILVATLVALRIIVTIRIWHAPANFFGSVNVEFFLLDVLTAVAFIAVALRANRIYPLWLSSIQLIAVTSHFAAGLKTSAPVAYAVMNIGPSYLLVLIVLAGIYAQHRRTKRFGAVRAWRSDPLTGSSARSIRSPQG